MDFGVVDHLTGIRVMILCIAVPTGRIRIRIIPASERIVRDEPLLSGLAGDEARVGVGEYGTLDPVANGIVEEGDTVVLAIGGHFIGVRLDGHPALIHRGVHIPAFTEDNDGWIDLVERGTDLLHRLKVDQTHEIESEAVYVVVLGPVGHRIDDVLAHHLAFGGGIVTATGIVDERTVGIVPEVVARNRLVERVAGRVIDMVVDHIHDHANVVLVQFLDHLLHFGDTCARIAWIGGIRTFRHIVILRIVAPVLRAGGVVAQVTGLVDGTVVVHRHDLHVTDAQGLQIVQAGSRTLGGLRAGLHDTEVLALPVGGDAGVRTD